MQIVEYKSQFLVYFLCRRGEVVYVGKTNSVKRRLSEHRKDGKQWERVFLLPCEEEKMNELESMFIAVFEPTYNKEENKKGRELSPYEQALFQGAMLMNGEFRKYIGDGLNV